MSSSSANGPPGLSTVHTCSISGVATLIEYVTTFMTLLPGDVILTGTPEGVGPLSAGDLVEVEVDGVGPLANPVEAGT